LAASYGVASGSEDQVDAAEPPVNGTIDTGMPGPALGPLGVCARAKSNDYKDPVTGLPDGDGLSAKYTLNGTGGPGSSVSAITIEITTNATFYFGPQGTHYGPSVTGANCSATNLGPLGPIPATVKVTSGSTTCTGSGSFWRAAADGFSATAALTGSPCGGSLTFTGVYQPPCGLPVVACINGVYTLQ